MATINIWQQFKSLIPEGRKTVVTVVTVNGSGTCLVRLRNGDLITVKGGTATEGQKMFIEKGEIKGGAPNLEFYEAEV